MTTTFEPVWEPLEAACRRFHFDCGDFMFMITRDGDVADTLPVPIYSYKHHETRRYLHLDGGGNAYEYTDTGTFAPLSLADAVLRAYS